jgi:hypothetical protein
MKYQRIPDEEYEALKGHVRGEFRKALNSLRCHGLDPQVDTAIEDCVRIAEVFAMAVRGSGKPVLVLKEYRRRATDD